MSNRLRSALTAAVALTPAMGGCGVPPTPNLSVLPSVEEREGTNAAKAMPTSVSMDVNLENIPNGFEKMGSDIYNIFSGKKHPSLQRTPDSDKGPSWDLLEEKKKNAEKAIVAPAPVPARRDSR